MVDSTSTKDLLPLKKAVKQATGLDFSRQLLYRWRDSGKLRCVKLGREWLTTVSEVSAMVAREMDSKNSRTETKASTKKVGKRR